MPKPQETESRFESLPVPDCGASYTNFAAPITLPRDVVVLYVYSTANAESITVRFVQAPATNVAIVLELGLNTLWGRFDSIQSATVGVTSATAGYVA